MERRPHVRLILSRYEWKPHDVDPEAMKQELKKSDITSMLSYMIRDPVVPIRQQLSVLNGWVGKENQPKDELSIFAVVLLTGLELESPI